MLPDGNDFDESLGAVGGQNPGIQVGVSDLESGEGQKEKGRRQAQRRDGTISEETAEERKAERRDRRKKKKEKKQKEKKLIKSKKEAADDTQHRLLDNAEEEEEKGKELTQQRPSSTSIEVRADIPPNTPVEDNDVEEAEEVAAAEAYINPSYSESQEVVVAGSKDKKHEMNEMV